MEVDGRVEERRGNIYIYQKGYQHGQSIQLLLVIMLHDLCVTVFAQKAVPFFILLSRQRTIKALIRLRRCALLPLLWSFSDHI